MKRLLLLLGIAFLLASCGSTTRLTPEDIKAVTTAQIGESYDLVFSSAVSLLQSQGYLITDADKTTGFITASWQKDDKWAPYFKIIFGSATESSTAQASVFLQPLRGDLTEVKLTIYRGEVRSELTGEQPTESKTVMNSMVQNVNVYQNWFDALEKEVADRKVLMRQVSGD